MLGERGQLVLPAAADNHSIDTIVPWQISMLRSAYQLNEEEG